MKIERTEEVTELGKSKDLLAWTTLAQRMTQFIIPVATVNFRRVRKTTRAMPAVKNTKSNRR